MPKKPAIPAKFRALALDHEYREIQRQVNGSNHGDDFRIASRLAVTPDDLLQAFNEEHPQVVHFSGHGTSTNELVLLDENRQPTYVTKEAIEALFKTLRDNIRVVVLNACFSKEQASAITKYIDCAVGMKREIGDEAAIKFAGAFYRAIGFGCSIKEAFEQATVALKLASIPEDLTPQLFCRKGLNAGDIKLFDS